MPFDIRQSHPFFKEHCPWKNKVEWHKETEQGKKINWGVEVEMSRSTGNGRLTKRETKNLSCLQRSYSSLVLILISEYCIKRNSDIQKTSFILYRFNLIIHNDKYLFQGNDIITIKYRYVPNFYQHLNNLSTETEYFPTLYTLSKIYPALWYFK